MNNYGYRIHFAKQNIYILHEKIENYLYFEI